MDEYTRKTKVWLETRRFNSYDDRGIYNPHQPIYGFKNHRGKPDIVGMYLITYQIMKVLPLLKFKTFVDVGGAEGFTAHIVRQLFRVEVRSSDLSSEACKRAEEIFGIKSVPADIHKLPFKDGEFDVALCSETLEHASKPQKAVNEILRITEKAVVITVPHESKEVTERNLKEKISHAHIHSFNLTSFDYLKAKGYRLLKRKMMTPLLRIPRVLVEAVPIKLPAKKSGQKLAHPRFLLEIYNALIPLLRRFSGRRTIAFLIRLDDFICRFTSAYGGMLVVIIKDKECLKKDKIKSIAPSQIINFAVPYGKKYDRKS